MRFIALIFLVVTASACTHVRYNEANLSEKRGEILRMQRTACFGACPQYELKIFDDGLMFYKGKRYVNHLGCGYAKFKPREVDVLVKALVNKGLFELKDKYPLEGKAPVDLPQCHLFVKYQGEAKAVVDYSWETPRNLLEIQLLVDSFAARKKLHFCDK